MLARSLDAQSRFARVGARAAAFWPRIVERLQRIELSSGEPSPKILSRCAHTRGNGSAPLHRCQGIHGTIRTRCATGLIGDRSLQTLDGAVAAPLVGRSRSSLAGPRIALVGIFRHFEQIKNTQAVKNCAPSAPIGLRNGGLVRPRRLPGARLPRSLATRPRKDDGALRRFRPLCDTARDGPGNRGSRYEPCGHRRVAPHLHRLRTHKPSRYPCVPAMMGSPATWYLR